MRCAASWLASGLSWSSVTARTEPVDARPTTSLTPVLPTISATAYLTPLREGGSLPGLMEADDLGTYVVKFTGAGQGPKSLVAEIVVGELGRLLGVPVPRLALIEVEDGEDVRGELARLGAELMERYGRGLSRSSAGGPLA